jgi:Phospholipase_D-nuclease N-terminal
VNGEGALALVVAAVPVLLIYGFAAIDLVRRHLSFTATAAWVTAIVLVPGIGVLAYFVLRPLGAADAGESGATGVADTVDAMRGRWEAGEMDDASYLRAKQQLFRV